MLTLDAGEVTQEEIVFSEIAARIRDVRVSPTGMLNFSQTAIRARSYVSHLPAARSPKNMVKTIGCFLLAVITAYLLGAIFISQGNIFILRFLFIKMDFFN